MIKKDPIKELFKIYKFEKPLSDDQKKQLNRSKSRSLVAILKKQKKFTPILLLSVTVFFWIKRFGINISLGQSLVAAVTSIVFATGTLSAGTYYAARHFFFPDRVKELKKEDKEIKTVVPEPHYRIVIAGFAFENDIAQVGKKVNGIIVQDLIQHWGASAIGLMGAKGSEHAGRIITGSVVKMEKSYLITAKIIDRKTSQIILYTTETALSDADIPRACRTIAGKISGRI